MKRDWADVKSLVFGSVSVMAASEYREGMGCRC